MQPEFREYARQIVANAKVLAETLAAEGFRIISGGTDTHLMLVDVFSKGILGSEAEKALGEAAITVNKNAIPFDTNPPMKPSGIRIGTPALTTRGMKEEEMKQVGRWISEALHHRTDAAVLGKIRKPGFESGGGFPAVSRAASQGAGGSTSVIANGGRASRPSWIKLFENSSILTGGTPVLHLLAELGALWLNSPRESRHRHPAHD